MAKKRRGRRVLKQKTNRNTNRKVDVKEGARRDREKETERDPEVIYALADSSVLSASCRRLMDEIEPFTRFWRQNI
ncbi:hypothetical protein PAMP_014486 [Pampus punctatissimus]